ncbi:unnamed protein product [Pedinophyceae sp. YPF-701]|nr:unnamed protein product [Pedinophyceae sp. YPF-701]
MAGQPPGFPDLSALQEALNDPAMKAMAEQVAQDPAFRKITEQLQGVLGGGMGEGGPSPDAAPKGMPDPAMMAQMMQGGEGAESYAKVMEGLFQNEQFMQMAQTIGQQLMQDPTTKQMMEMMQNENVRKEWEEKMKTLQEDPEVGDVLKEIESGGPQAMMKYWNDPDVLAKLGKAFGDQFNMEGAAAGEGEDAGEEEGSPLHAAASDGDAEALEKLLKEKDVDVNKRDEEGRTALHFACGYGEKKCAELLLEAGADVECQDDNKNTPLHYAAGYDQKELVELLLSKNASTSAKNDDKKTPMDVAEINERAEIVALLKGAK